MPTSITYAIEAAITPHYTIRYSQKAKHLQMRMRREGLEIIVPAKRKPSVRIMELFIQENLPWIEATWQRLQATQPIPEPALPTVIELKSINETWTVNYLPVVSKTVKLMANLSHQLTLIGDVTNEARCLQQLRVWLQQKAKVVLYPQLVALAQETGLFFNQMVIRNNTTRWGSCSPEKNISLCCNLLFLPPHLVRHILLHELCHTKVLHHGPAFWRYLTKWDRDARLHARQLREVKVPRWVRIKKKSKAGWASE